MILITKGDFFMSQTFTMDDLRARLSERQHKMTPQRQIVLQIFLDHPGEHLSAEDVHDILRTEKAEIGLATVYRTLEQSPSGIAATASATANISESSTGSRCQSLSPNTITLITMITLASFPLN